MPREVGAEPVLEDGRLADVGHPAGQVAHDVDAGALRGGPEPLAEEIGVVDQPGLAGGGGHRSLYRRSRRGEEACRVRGPTPTWVTLPEIAVQAACTSDHRVQSAGPCREAVGSGEPPAGAGVAAGSRSASSPPSRSGDERLRERAARLEWERRLPPIASEAPATGPGVASLAPASAASAPTPTPPATDLMAYVATTDGNLVPVDMTAGRAEAPIPVDLHPEAIAITPDGRTAYVADAFAATVTPVDLTTGVVGAPISIASNSGISSVAINPSGTTAYVSVVPRAPRRAAWWCPYRLPPGPSRRASRRARPGCHRHHARRLHRLRRRQRRRHGHPDRPGDRDGRSAAPRRWQPGRHRDHPRRSHRLCDGRPRRRGGDPDRTLFDPQP